MVSFIRSDLAFILDQIKIAEAHAGGEQLLNLLPNAQVPWGLRTLSGEYNNLIHPEFGAADNPFPRLTTPSFVTESNTGGTPPPPGFGTDYSQTGNIVDMDPRLISNLIVDQTASNPAATAAALQSGATLVASPGLDGVFGNGDDKQVYLLPNVTPDEGLSAPFNSWMTFFGQFFDHGLDLLSKSSTEIVFIPLMLDDPLYVADSPTNFMVLSRALNGPDAPNTTSPFVDQNQTYSSHPSHQVFLRGYELVDGKPVPTGKLLTNRDLGADGKYGTSDDVEIGGMATWAVLKAQARDVLGIELKDSDVGSVPLLATDAYGRFIPGLNGFPQVVTGSGLVEGNPAAPISLTGAMRTGHAFLDDIAHNANPTGKTADGDSAVGLAEDGGSALPGTYDDELLDAHYVAGDGRVNENIGLTAVHAIFHAEHNRLAEQTKQVLLDDAAAMLAGGATQADAVAFLNEWLTAGVASVPSSIEGLQWNGERLFQAAKFGTEMQYQHLVFEEFARTVQPNVDAFLAPNGYDVTIDPSIVAEFAHTVYRFGHSMLTETVDRLDANLSPVNGDPQLGLIAAFLNPLAYAASGATPEEATAAIVRGVTRQAGNEIDEFVTEALRSNLLGIPLDLAALNIARGRETGIPSLNEARRQFYEQTGDEQLKPYTSWADLVHNLRHAESLINFIAAYGTHDSITSVTALVDKRAAATLLVLGGSGEPPDREDFLNSTGAWASGPDGRTTTGLDAIDFWIGGLAEKQMPFGGLLGSTFNFVFETQLEDLQNGDRFYYLSRTAGLHFGAQLEENSFSKLVMLNTGATHLPGNIFQAVTWTLEVDASKQLTGLGADGREDPNAANGHAGITIRDVEITPLVLRDNPHTAAVESNYLHYTGADHVVLGGTANADTLIAGAGDDTVYGDEGDDIIEGGYGNDKLIGGAGNDIITDRGGDDTIDGGAGHDVIQAGNMAALGAGNLIFGGDGNDFIITTEDISTTFGGKGDDFILGAKTNLPPTGNEGDDWIEMGTQDGAPGDNFSPVQADDVLGNDIFIGGPGFDEMIGEGGDDIFTGSDAQDKMDGNSGFDWVTYKNDLYGVTADLLLPILAQPHGNTPNANNGATPVGFSPDSLLDRFAEVEGLSGSSHADILRGDDEDAAGIAEHGGGQELTNINLITGLQELLGPGVTSFGGGNIILGGASSDLIEGRGGNDLIDGDKWLNVKIGVYADETRTGDPIAVFSSMTEMITLMLNGTYSPGQLKAIREIVDDNNDFDTAVFSDPFETDRIVGQDANGNDILGPTRNYLIVTVDGVTTVTHLQYDNGGTLIVDGAGLPVPGPDGIDTLKNIERLLFGDGRTFYLPGAQVLNSDPTGTIAINDATPTVGETLTASINRDTIDPDGPVTSSVTYIWQVETVPGSGIFDDIVVGPEAEGISTATGPKFTITPDLAGLALRVKGIFVDAHGVTETAFSTVTTAVADVPPAPPVATGADPAPANTGPGIFLAKSDLAFILDQIKIAEANAAGTPLIDLLPNVRAALGLRTVSGENNNLVHPEYGAGDNLFPRLSDPVFPDAGPVPTGFGPPGSTSYTQTSGNVFDSDPRTISNLIVDQTANNPAAVAANGGATPAVSPGLDGVFGTADDKDVFYIPNVAPDEGLSAPFNSWMTFFGQFFDHGLDLVTKGGSGTVFIPLLRDDPLYVEGSPTNFMVMTRATNQPGADGILGTADDVREHSNTTSPFVDQNQTYSAHPSHQVFLRGYELVGGKPVATGKLITNRDLGADGKYGTPDDVELGGMATWAVVKAQARDILGIDLRDSDVTNAPLLATDAYGNFLRGPNGFPQVVMKGPDGKGGTSDDILVEGNPAGPISLTDAVRTGHAFLDDIAHTASPAGKTADGDSVVGLSEDGAPAIPGTYDNELLDAHYIAGDGRVNENIGLTAVHAVFHSEHNRLVEQTKNTIVSAGDLSFLNEWLRDDVAALPATAVEIAALQWDGERLFQAAKFGTEMQYQHLVFEEFARMVQPNVDLFFAPTQVYDVELDASIVAEFAHTVYRFGHSMLTETVDRYDADFNAITSNGQQLGLIAAFLNPLAFAASGSAPDEAVGAIVRGVTRQAGNEIDEFVTEALRNNLVGLPLDLAALNIARGRDTGIPTLNAFRRDIHQQTGDSQLKPYVSWADLVMNLKHPESIINFIAAYGTHDTITSAVTLADKRTAAALIVLGGEGAPDDRLAFLNGTGAYANLSDGRTVTGVDAIDFWIGGLAEKQMPFGGMLGSSFNFVFENQLEKLQDGDRFYYLERTAGLAFNAELEGNSFARLIMANSDATHLPGLVFQNVTWTLEVDQSKQLTGEGIDGRADPVGDSALIPLVIRDNPATSGPDSNYLRYTGGDHVVLGGTNPGNTANPSGDDILIAGDGDDTVWGDAGNDRIEGGNGNDQLRGGAGHDIITDLGGDDNIQGGDGHDFIHGGNGVNLIIGGAGNDFIISGEDASEVIGGQGNDFILGSKANEQDMGNEGDDWIEKGTSDGAPGDNFDPLANDPIVGNDVFIGDGENDKFNGEGGDDIMSGKTGFGDRYIGGSGYDWAIFKNDPTGVHIDMSNRFFDQPLVPGGTQPLIRFDMIEGLSGSNLADVLRGDDEDATTLPGAGAQGSVLTNIALIDGLGALLDTALGSHQTFFDGGNIILGGGGSDIIEGRGGDDIIDGDLWLNVRISVRQGFDDAGPVGGEIATFDTMTDPRLIANMLNGTWNPGQLQIVREILTSSGPNFDTAVFRGNRADYEITTIGGVTTVTDISAAPIDGTDRLINIERLQFADQAVVLNGLNNAPVGAPTISDVSPVSGQTLTVSMLGVTDADNTATGGAVPNPVAYFWEVDRGAGFEEIQVAAAGEIARAAGPSFTVTADLSGFALRVRAIYKDANDVLETVYSNPTFAVDNSPPDVAGPVALAAILEDAGPVTISAADLLVNAIDPEGLPLTVLNLQLVDPAAGSVADLGNGDFAFTPAPEFSGNVAFTFDITDGLNTVPSSAAMTVTPVNDAPTGIALALLATVPEDTPVTVTAEELLTGIFDPEGDPMTIVDLIAFNATVTALEGGNSFLITPDADFSGTVLLQFNVRDSNGGELQNQFVGFDVEAANDAPSGTPTAILPSFAEDSIATITATQLLRGFTDADGDTLRVTGVTASNGTVTANGGGNTFRITPNADFNGTMTVTYTVTDGNGGNLTGQTRSYAVSPVNDAPVGSATAALPSVLEDQSILVLAETLLQGFTDPDGNALSITGLTATNATVIPEGSSFRITPNANFNGTVTLSYGVTDGTAILGGQTRTLTVASVNDAPTAINISSASVAEFAATNSVVGTLATDDPDSGETTTFELVGNSGGLFKLVGNQVRVANGPALDFEQAASHAIQVRATDSTGASVLRTIIIGVTNIDPERFTGTASNERFVGGSGADRIDAAGGADILEGRSGADILTGGGGNDTFIATANDGNDTYNGGAGSDLLDLSSTITGIRLNLDSARHVVSGVRFEANSATGFQTGTDRILSIENAKTGSSTDWVVSSTAANSISLGGHNDRLIADPDNVRDEFDGESGNDTLDYSEYGTAIQVTLNGSTTVTVFGSGTSAATSDLVRNFENILSGSGNDSLTGDSNDNALSGGIGNDTISGGAGADSLAGGAGADRLVGGSGDDELTGGAGADRIVFAPGFGNDVVTDFDANAAGGQDTIDLTAFGITNFLAAVSIVDIGADTVVSIASQTITFKGVNGVGNNVIEVTDFAI